MKKEWHIILLKIILTLFTGACKSVQPIPVIEDPYAKGSIRYVDEGKKILYCLKCKKLRLVTPSTREIYIVAGNCVIPNEVKQLPHLETLLIDANKCKIDTTTRFKKLKRLRLISQSLESIPNWIISCPQLVSLDIALDDEQSINSSISRLKNLEKLYVKFDKLRMFPNALIDLNLLKSLNIEMNNRKSIEIILPGSIKKMENLESLSLPIKLNHSTLIAITSLKNLKYLAVESLSDDLPLEVLYQSLGQLKGFYVINTHEKLDGNRLNLISPDRWHDN